MYSFNGESGKNRFIKRAITMIKYTYYIRKVFLYLLVMILVSSFIYLYSKGVFHPKYFKLNKIVIMAPNNTYLYNVTINDNVIFDVFSPLVFSNIFNYNIISTEEIDILFFNPSEPELLNITAKRLKLIHFKEYITELKKIESLVHLDTPYDYCNNIYKYQSNNIETLIFFNYQENIKFSLSSNKTYIIYETIEKICNKPVREVK